MPGTVLGIRNLVVDKTMKTSQPQGAHTGYS